MVRYLFSVREIGSFSSLGKLMIMKLCNDDLLSEYLQIHKRDFRYPLYKGRYSNCPHIRNSVFHLRPKNVSYNTRIGGNEGQCFLYEGPKLVAFHISGPKKCQVLYVNINGYKSKMESVKRLLEELDIDIVMLAETKVYSL